MRSAAGWITILLFTASATVPVPAAAQDEEVPALNFAINAPSDLALDNSGHLYVAEGDGARVLRIDLQKGTISIAAGNGKDCCFQEGAKATDVSVDCLCAIAVDSAGNLYIGEFGGYIRKVDAQAGLITTVAGAGEFGSTAEGAPALAAKFDEIGGLAIDASGNLLIADGGRIFRLDAKTHAVTTYAGKSTGGFGGDGGPAQNASFNRFGAIAFDATGNLLIGDYGNCRIRRINHATRIVTTVAVTGHLNPDGSCQEARSGNASREPLPSDPAADASGNVYFEEGAIDVVERVDAHTGAVSTVAGTGDRGFSGDGGPATEATFGSPSGLAIDTNGNLYISDWINNRIRRVDAKTGIITTIAGNGLPNRIDIEE